MKSQYFSGFSSLIRSHLFSKKTESYMLIFAHGVVSSNSHFISAWYGTCSGGKQWTYTALQFQSKEILIYELLFTKDHLDLGIC